MRKHPIPSAPADPDPLEEAMTLPMAAATLRELGQTQTACTLLRKALELAEAAQR